MKRSIYFLLTGFVFLCLMNSCELLDITFTTGDDEITFTVNPSEAGEYVLTEELLQSELKQEIEDHGGNMDNLKQVTVNEAVLNVLTAGKNLNPFEWVEVYISTPNISEKLIASVSSIPDGTTSIALQLSGEDLKALVEEEEYTIRVVGELGESIDEAIDCVLKIKYDVEVGV